MEFMDMFTGMVHDKMKGLYKTGTGRNLDSDINMFYDEWKWEDDYRIRDRYYELQNNHTIREVAELEALEKLVTERGLKVPY